MKFLAVHNESSLYSKWVPNCKASGLLKQVTENEAAFYELLSFPVISNREAILTSWCYDRLDKLGEFWVFGKSFNNNKEYIKKNNIKIPKRNSVKIDFNFYLTRVKILGTNKIKCSLVCNSDPNMKWCPFWIINKIAKSTFLQFFKNIKKNCNKFQGSAFEKKMKDNAHVYSWIQKSVNAYLKKF
jgi:hypothetical protein